MQELREKIAGLAQEAEAALASRPASAPSPAPPTPEVRAERILGETEERSEEILNLHRRAVERLESNLEGLRQQLEAENASGERAAAHQRALARRIQVLSEYEGASQQEAEQNSELAAQLAGLHERFAETAAASKEEEAALNAALAEVSGEYAEAEQGHLRGQQELSELRT